jgi:hypothetical protein
MLLCSLGASCSLQKHPVSGTTLERQRSVIRDTAGQASVLVVGSNNRVRPGTTVKASPSRARIDGAKTIGTLNGQHPFRILGWQLADFIQTH